MNDVICLDCGYKSDINDFNVTSMDEGDPNPVIECPKCRGCGEFYTEGIISFIKRTKKDKAEPTDITIDFDITEIRINKPLKK